MTSLKIDPRIVHKVKKYPYGKAWGSSDDGKTWNSPCLNQNYSNNKSVTISFVG